MVKGAKYWNDPGSFYCQMNNPTEVFLQSTMGERQGWLQSCGPTAAVNCLASMGVPLKFKGPGVYRPQPEEVLMDYFNDPRNISRLREVRRLPDNIPGNRVPQYYEMAVEEVFAQRAEFRWGCHFDTVANHVSAGNPVMICLESPSHYVAVVAFDTDTAELVYHDSWGARFPDGRGGFSRRMARAEFSSNVKSYHIVFGLL